MKREDFKVSIETRDELVTKDEKSVSVSITTNGGRQWITLPALIKDEVMLLHDELEKFFLEGISVQTLEKRLSEMSEGEVFGIKAIDENGKQVWWRVKKLVVFGQEPTYFAGVIGNNDTIGSFGSKNDMEKLANNIIDYICEVSMNFCYGKKFIFKFSD